MRRMRPRVRSVVPTGRTAAERHPRDSTHTGQLLRQIELLLVLDHLTIAERSAGAASRTSCGTDRYHPGMSFDLAQVNVSRLLAPLESPQMAPFMAALDEVNAEATRHRASCDGCRPRTGTPPR